MTWLGRLLHGRRLEAKLDAELRDHIERAVADKIRAGRNPAQARREALLQLGGLEGLKEECREARGTVWLESLARDLRFAARTLRLSPAFTVAAICTLALGIGANTAIFGLLDAVRLRSLPVQHPGQLVQIVIPEKNGWGVSQNENTLSYALWQQLHDHHRPFSGVLAWTDRDVPIGDITRMRRVRASLVTSNFFHTLGVQPAAGRLFRDDTCDAGVVLGYGFWQTEYGGSSSAVGRRIVIDNIPMEIIGVSAPGFHGLEVEHQFDVAAPICWLRTMQPTNDWFTRSDLSWLTVLARRAPGWSIEQANDYLRAISPGLMQATIPTGYSTQVLSQYRAFRLQAKPAANGISRLRTRYSSSLYLLLGVTGLVLLIACANLANLMLARASARQREFALRLAIGASGRRLIQQSLCESLLLAATGAVLGAALARLLSMSILAFLNNADDPLTLAVGVDWRVLAFIAGVAIACCVLFGLAPALRASRMDPGDTIRSGGRGLTAAHARFSFQRALVVVQVSVSLVLVVGALLFVRSFRNLLTLDPGFRSKGVLLATIDLSHAHAREKTVLDEIRGMPRIDSVATTTNFVVTGGMWHLGVHAGAVLNSSAFTWVSPGHFATLDMPLLAGRDFTDRDRNVAIVNQAFVRRFFGDANPIGRTFRTITEPNYPATDYQIIGVVKDTRYFDLHSPIEAMAYAPQTSNDDYMLAYIRSSAPLGSIISEVRERLSRLHPGIAVELHPFRQQIDISLTRDRLMAALSGFFGALAVILAAVGLYGVIAYIAVRRQNELGIRMALGATRSEVIALVMKDAALLVGAGAFIGTVCAAALASTAASLLFGLRPRDPITYIAAIAVLAAVAVLGAWIPAHRASRLDPMTALRCD
ncbi:MAG TPA: ABC transporter permease [Bryobacteraceae bacterium]|nr:ABC transporter permease [Bryobacteraceae bacterium]